MGGVSLFVCSPAAPRLLPGCSFHPPFPASSWQIFRQSWQIFRQTGQKGAKVNKFLGVLGVFSGKSETKKGKNKNLFYFRGFRGAAFILFCGGGGRAHWVQACRLSRIQDLKGVGSGPLVVCSLPFMLSLALLSLRWLANMALFRILRAF